MNIRNPILSLSTIAEFLRDLKHRGKREEDKKIFVKYINILGFPEDRTGVLSDDLTSFKIDGVPGIRIIKYPVQSGPGSKKGTQKVLLWASYNSLTNLDFNYILSKDPLIKDLTSADLEALMLNNDARVLAGHDYSLYAMCFITGLFFGCTGVILAWVIWQILKLFLMVMANSGGA